MRRRKENDVADRQAGEDRGDTGPGEGAGSSPGLSPLANVAVGTLATGANQPGESPGIERVKQADPLRGWKIATLRFAAGQGLFCPLNSQAGPYKAEEAQATCANGYRSIGSYSLTGERYGSPPHYAGPVLECSCGFYAHKARADAEAPIGYAMLEVDLYGTVIEHETGYRAGKQRVLSAEVSPRCYYCPDDGVMLGIMGIEVPLAAGPLWPLCGAHVHLAPVTIERDHLGALLGTEVRWR